MHCNEVHEHKYVMLANDEIKVPCQEKSSLDRYQSTLLHNEKRNDRVYSYTGCFTKYALFRRLFNHASVSVERRNPHVGTSAFKKGSENHAARKKSTTTIYVRSAIAHLLVQLVSRAFCHSTFLFLSCIACISCSIFIIADK